MSHAAIRKWASLFSLLAPFPLLAMPSFAAAEMVVFSTEMAPGTVVVHTSERRLYLVPPRGQALRYIVGVGRIGWKWAGTSSISGKFIKPNWVPPAALRRCGAVMRRSRR